MRKVILLGLLLCIGVATSFGQKSAVQVFGVPFGSTYEEFLTAFKEKGFTGKTYIYEGGSVRFPSPLPTSTKTSPEWSSVALSFRALRRSMVKPL